MNKILALFAFGLFTSEVYASASCKFYLNTKSVQPNVVLDKVGTAILATEIANAKDDSHPMYLLYLLRGIPEAQVFEILNERPKIEKYALGLFRAKLGNAINDSYYDPIMSLMTDRVAEGQPYFYQEFARSFADIGRMNGAYQNYLSARVRSIIYQAIQVRPITLRDRLRIKFQECFGRSRYLDNEICTM